MPMKIILARSCILFDFYAPSRRDLQNDMTYRENLLLFSLLLLLGIRCALLLLIFDACGGTFVVVAMMM